MLRRTLIGRQREAELDNPTLDRSAPMRKSEVDNLDASRVGGLGITPQELEAWQNLRGQRVQT